MRCPREQVRVVELVDNIIAGLAGHADKFPRCDAAVLAAAREDFLRLCAELVDAKARVAIIAAQKLEIFRKMQKDMKCQLKLGVVDNVNTPENLAIIGWGLKRPPTQLEIPGPPGNLRITAQGNDGLLCLAWDKSRSGGPVRSFIIERKQFSGSWSEFSWAGSCYDDNVKLTRQPSGCKLEYQVRASNTSGLSFPSNTVSVVL
jgi:hypothetical protein